METNNDKTIEGIKRVLSQIPQDEARRIVGVVFGELLASPFLSGFEQRHLERRRAELLADVRGQTGSQRAA